MFSKYPQWRGKVTFLQVAVPSRTDVKEYQDLKSDIDKLVGHINGRFSTPAWSPIRYATIQPNELIRILFPFLFSNTTVEYNFSKIIFLPKNFRYIFGSVNQQDLAAYYRDADVALVTPLRDGMNLVAKEFVACQTDANPGQ